MAGLEVVGDHDVAYERQSSALSKGRHLDIPDLKWAWHVSLEHTTNVTSLKRRLPAVLREAEQRSGDSPRGAQRLLRDSDAWEGLGLFTAHAYEDDQAGRVALMSAPFSGFGREADALAEWVEDVLRRQSDVGEKLSAACLGDEGHAFIWVTVGSAVPVQSLLDGARTDLPVRAPTLPRGITHVWVVSGFSSSRSLAWFPDRGWHEIPFRWADEQPLRLTQQP
ncbi:hypothetical protein ACI78V_05195 [Geodermatophilus sp. SYSU D00742]